MTSANQLLSQIASLNQSITQLQVASNGGQANDLIDTREQALEQLSNYVNIQTSTGSNGQIDVSIGGQQNGDGRHRVQHAGDLCLGQRESAG